MHRGSHTNGGSSSAVERTGNRNSRTWFSYIFFTILVHDRCLCFCWFSIASCSLCDSTISSLISLEGWGTVAVAERWGLNLCLVFLCPTKSIVHESLWLQIICCCWGCSFFLNISYQFSSPWIIFHKIFVNLWGLILELTLSIILSVSDNIFLLLCLIFVTILPTFSTTLLKF